MAPKTAAPRTEKGYVNGAAGMSTSWGAPQFDQFETVPELTWPNSIWTYSRMLREDARIASVLRAIGLPIRRTQWRIRPNGAQPEVVEHVAADLGLPIEGEPEDARPTPRLRGRFSWSAHLQEALKCQQFGHAAFELSYELVDGRARLRRVAPRPQSTIAYWNVDRSGDLLSIQQYPAGTFATPGMLVMMPSGMGDAIPADRLVVYLREPDPGVWTGNSLLRPCYKHWRLKDELLRIEAAAARRHGIGVPKITANEAESEDPERMGELLNIASAYRGGETAGLALTHGEDFDVVSPSGTPMDPRRAIEYHDHAMALVALAHFLNLEGKGGSYALASVQSDTFVQSIQSVAGDLRDTAQAGIVEDIVNRNWGIDEPAPLLVFDEIGSRQDPVAAALQMLVNAKLLTPDDRLEAFLRSASGLPAADPDSARETEAPSGGEGPGDEPPVDDDDESNHDPLGDVENMRRQLHPFGEFDASASSSTRSAAARSRQSREHPKHRQEALF